MKLDKRIFLALLGFLLSCKLASETPSLTHPTATLPSSPLPVAQAGGTAGFRDHLAIADQFFLTLTNVPAPPTGQVYQGWLVGDDGTILSPGILTLAPDGRITLTWNSPASENLLSRFTRFQITLEPTSDSENPTGQVVLSGGLEGVALENARRLFVKNDGQPVTPLNTAFALGLRAETDLATQHVTNAINAAAIGALDEMRAHLEHVINILEGAGGSHFGDHDGKGIAENPGDGFGVVGYAGQIAIILSGQPLVVEAAASIQAQSTVIQDKCMEILQLEDTAAAATQLSELQALIEQLETGPVADLYQTTQDSLRFEVTPSE